MEVIKYFEFWLKGQWIGDHPIHSIYPTNYDLVRIITIIIDLDSN